ncbi:phytosulfokine receptor 2-like [Pistacia vera]|uniref:phytosulfokine receptor 2-like n=1 Tax=Pistacia vera TaxID=55513 RepID=UPI001262EFF1|nr:phytosulfokine receptor 2-like [Pistacia vera]
MPLASPVQGLLAAIASFFFITLILAVILLFCKKTRKPETRNRTRDSARTQPHAELTSIATFDSASFDPSLNQISMAELLDATKNFSSDLIIGDGSFGFVYKAKLSNGVTVAIKKLDKDAFQGFREFRAEMETLGKLRHRNIVKILGYCVSDLDRVLIYEFVEKGNLDQWLHDTVTESDDVDDTRQSFCRLPLSWETRVNVVSGVANGLAYLHGLEKPIIHRDIKASNVLLDSDFEAHIADFGLARRIDTSHSHVSTQVAGTMGYMPPEYMGGNTAATVMLDVYSFGVLMIEVATQRRPNWPAIVDGKEVGLVEWSRTMVEQNREIEMVDSNISREELSENKVKEYFRIACNCTNEKTRERPAMKEVVKDLEELAS